MVEIISVRFKEGGKQYYFNPNGQQFQVGDGVIVDTTRGTEYGLCTHGNSMIDEIELMAPLRPVVRKATQEDKLTLERNKEKEKKAFAICQEKIAQHGLDMKLVEAEYSFEGNKVLFFFTSDGRVDFRALVKDLAGTIHARIELRQIGVKMAKTQNLSLNPTKISGACGRLMCCLKYEQDAYEDLVKHAPKQESFVETPDGAGTVSSVNLLRQTVQVRLDSAPETPKCYHNCELCVIRNGKGKRPDDYVQPPLEELAKLRRPTEEDQAKKEADALTVALENAFPGRPAKELRRPAENAATPDQEERPAKPRRNRTRRPRPQGEDRPQNQNQDRPRQDQRPPRQEPFGEGKKPEFRRRPPRRPQEGNGEPRQQAPQQERRENQPGQPDREGGANRPRRRRRRPGRGNGPAGAPGGRPGEE